MNRWWRRPGLVLGAVSCALFVVVALAAPWLAPHAPYDPVNVLPPGMSEEDAMLMADLGGIEMAEKPPMWIEGGQREMPLGTDDQARDLLSVTLYGLRTSLLIGVGAVALQVLIGLGIGLIAGYRGGWLDAMCMRVADIQLAFSTLMVAIIALAICKATVGYLDRRVAVWVLVVVIGVAEWPQIARTVRASTLSIRTREYVLAARALGRRTVPILLRHVLPNILAPVFVLATVQMANAIMAEAALSFLGLGMPPDQPSLGALIHAGYGNRSAWWICLVPGMVLCGLIAAVNLLGDQLRRSKFT